MKNFRSKNRWYLNFFSFNNYAVDSYEVALKQLDFPNYKTFDDVNGA